MNSRSIRIARLCAVCRPIVRGRSFVTGRQWMQQPHYSSQSGEELPLPEERQGGFQLIREMTGPRPSYRGAKARDDRIKVSLNNQQWKFSAVLLRDMCECPACVDPSTKQKFFATPEIPTDILTQEVSTSESGIKIQWRNDIPGWNPEHTTEISWDVLRSIVQTGLVEEPFSPGPQTVWDTSEFNRLRDFNYEAYMQDDATLHVALNQLHTHGLLFLTDVPESETSVSTIGERIGPIKNTFYGYTWDVRSVPEAKNVAYTSQNLGFHMDLMYMHQPPHLQLLHCIRSSARGGASQFTDSYRAARDLFLDHPEDFEQLANFEVTFHYNHPSSNLYKQLRRVIQMQPLHAHGKKFTSVAHYVRHLQESGLAERDNPASLWSDVQSQIESISWSPPFQGPFTLKRPTDPPVAKHSSEMLNNLIDSWHKPAQKFNELIHRPDGVYERLMRPGECVIFDNRRVLHGRKEFEVGDAGTERWLRGAYLDKDPYMSKLQVLERLFGGVTPMPMVVG